MIEREYIKSTLLYYLLIIFGVGGGSIFLIIDTWKKQQMIPAPLVFMSIISIVGGITGIILLIIKWHKGKSDPTERIS